MSRRKPAQTELFSLVNETKYERHILVHRIESAKLIASYFKERKITGKISPVQSGGPFRVIANCSDAEFDAVRQQFNTRQFNGRLDS